MRDIAAASSGFFHELPYSINPFAMEPTEGHGIDSVVAGSNFLGSSAKIACQHSL
jgi:hypothetical protein